MKFFDWVLWNFLTGTLITEKNADTIFERLQETIGQYAAVTFDGEVIKVDNYELKVGFSRIRFKNGMQEVELAESYYGSHPTYTYHDRRQELMKEAEQAS